MCLLGDHPRDDLADQLRQRRGGELPPGGGGAGHHLGGVEGQVAEAVLPQHGGAVQVGVEEQRKGRLGGQLLGEVPLTGHLQGVHLVLEGGGGRGRGRSLLVGGNSHSFENEIK